ARIHLLHDRANRRGQRHWIGTRCFDDEGCLAARRRPEYHFARRLIEAVRTKLRNHADDAIVAARRISDADALADRVLIGPESVGELARDDCRRRVRRRGAHGVDVAPVEASPAHLDAERLEVARERTRSVDAWRFLVRRERSFAPHAGATGAKVLQRQAAARANLRYPGKRGDPLLELLVEVDHCAAALVVQIRQTHVEGEHAIWIEAWLHVPKIGEAAQHQPRGGEQDQREGDLTHYETVARGPLSRRGRRRAAV